MVSCEWGFPCRIILVLLRAFTHNYVTSHEKTQTFALYISAFIEQRYFHREVVVAFFGHIRDATSCDHCYCYAFYSLGSRPLKLRS